VEEYLMQADNAYQTTFTLPTGATSGTRIVIDGIAGTITGYYADNRIAFQLSTTPAAGIADLQDDPAPHTAGFYNGTMVVTGNNPLNTLVNAASINWDTSVQNMVIHMLNSTGALGSITLNNFVSALGNLAFSQTAPISVWNTPTFVGSWAGGSTASALYKPLRWMFDAEDNLIVKGAAHLTAGVAAGTQTIATTGVNTGVPWNSQEVTHLSPADALYPAESRRVTLTAAGNITMSNTAASVINDNYYINMCVPLSQLL
jgi:hypothetical protein